MSLSIKHKIQGLNWQPILSELNHHGYALIPSFMSKMLCEHLIKGYLSNQGYRKKVEMQPSNFGFGEYKNWDYPLPELIQTLRETLYQKLVPVANTWMQSLNINTRFPDLLPSLQAQCVANGQLIPSSLILKYPEGGYINLHQDIYGKVYFPLQAIIPLNQKDEDYLGGTFVLTKQGMSGQTKAIELAPKRGDMLIFTTNFKPEMGVKGYYKVKVKHGVKEVLGGERYAMGIIFHDATH